MRKKKKQTLTCSPWIEVLKKEIFAISTYVIEDDDTEIGRTTSPIFVADYSTPYGVVVVVVVVVVGFIIIFSRL